MAKEDFLRLNGTSEEHTGASRARLFFVVGPLRTGSSLMARCLDDHPAAICLCESEINRALFRDYIVAHHCQRMNAHGFSTGEAIAYLDRKKQDDVEGLERWYSEVRPRLGELYGKPDTVLLGDKSPDLYRSAELVHHLVANYPLIYTVRDPRAIYASIMAQDDATPEDKEGRWSTLVENFRAWRPYLDRPNILVVRYEDLVTSPGMTMTMTYSHLGLPDSSRFLTPFPRLYPYRFLWSTAIDWETGIRREFDPRRINGWLWKLNKRELERIESDDRVAEFMDRFGYERQPRSIRGPWASSNWPS